MGRRCLGRSTCTADRRHVGESGGDRSRAAAHLVHAGIGKEQGRVFIGNAARRRHECVAVLVLEVPDERVADLWLVVVSPTALPGARSDDTCLECRPVAELAAGRAVGGHRTMKLLDLRLRPETDARYRGLRSQQHQEPGVEVRRRRALRSQRGREKSRSRAAGPRQFYSLPGSSTRAVAWPSLFTVDLPSVPASGCRRMPQSISRARRIQTWNRTRRAHDVKMTIHGMSNDRHGDFFTSRLASLRCLDRRP